MLTGIQELGRYFSTSKTKHKLKNLGYVKMELTKHIFSFAVHKVLYWVKVWTTVHQHQWKIFWGFWVWLTESHLCSSFTMTDTHALVNTQLQLTVAIHRVLSHLKYVFLTVSTHILDFVEYSLVQPTPIMQKLFQRDVHTLHCGSDLHQIDAQASTVLFEN